MKQHPIRPVCCCITAALFAALTATLLLSSCEKPVIDEPNDPTTGNDRNANVTLRFSAYQQEPFTRAAEPLADQLTRLSVAVFRMDGTKAKSINQTHADADFGQVALQLPAGTYRLVAIAHNGLASATVTSPEKVTFPSNKVTDTFAYCGTLTVPDGSAVEETVTLTRRVAMLRLTLTDDKLPDGVRQLKFYYTGGSSTYNPTTTFGCVNSKQTELRDCYSALDGSAVKTYELYTLPHQTTGDQLKMTITALDATGSELYCYVLTEIPVTINKITAWTGCLFGDNTGGGTITDGTITITLDTTWEGTINYSF